MTMNENDDVTSTYGELKPKPTCASGTKEQPRITDNDIARLTAEIDQRALAVASDARDKYGKALCDLRVEIRDVINRTTEIASRLGRIHDILKSVDK